MLTGIGIAAGIVLLLATFQWRNLKRLATVASAQGGKFSRWIWRVDPIAIYQEEVDKSAVEIQEAGEGLEQFRGLVSRLQRQVANGEKDMERLKQKIKSLLTEGNEDKASDYVLDLQRVQTQWIKDKTELTTQENTYQTNLKKVKYANQKIREAKEKAERFQSDLRMSKAEAEVSKLAQNFNVKTSSIDNLGEIEYEIQRQIDANRAKGQVIHDLSADGLEEMEEQEKIQKQQARELLEQFKQEMLPAPHIDVKVLPPMNHYEKN